MLCLASFLWLVSPVLCANILVFSRTTGFRHDSIPTAIAAVRSMASSLGHSITASEDPTLFSDSGLSPFDAIVFLMNSEPDTTPVSSTPPMLSSSQQDALAAFYAKGKGYIGIHSASAALFVDADYVRISGASFDRHPDLQSATFTTVSASSSYAATSSLPSRWTFQEEVYTFLGNPRDNGATVILSVDESSYSGYKGNASLQGSPHPIAWTRDKPVSLSGGRQASGRAFYTSLGHATATWSNQTFLNHIRGGIQWVVGGIEESPQTSAVSQGQGQTQTQVQASTQGSSGLVSSTASPSAATRSACPSAIPAATLSAIVCVVLSLDLALLA